MNKERKQEIPEKEISKREKLERFFYKNPNSEPHLRELGRTLELSTGFVSEKISSLVEKGIVIQKQKGNMKIFAANTSSKDYIRHKKAYNLDEILTSDLIHEIENQLYPDVLVLFGSFLKGTDTVESDIDLAVINGREKNLDLSKYEKEFERSINLVQIISLEDSEDEFVNTLINGFVLSGYLEVKK